MKIAVEVREPEAATQGYACNCGSQSGGGGGGGGCQNCGGSNKCGVAAAVQASPKPLDAASLASPLT